MINVESVLAEKYPSLFSEAPCLFRAPVIGLLKRMFREKTINRFLEENRGIAGIEFIEKVLGHFNLGYAVSNLDRENIPANGRVVIFANHPLGALDALCLVKLVSEVRSDVKIVANDMLMHLAPMRPLLLPVDAIGGQCTRRQLQRIQDALEQEQAVIFFPAGEVSRARPNGVRDTRWSSGFLKFAQRTGSPLLPCYIDARNSATFYSLSAVNKPAAGLLLVNEMFRLKARTLPVRIGGLIAPDVFRQDKRPHKTQVKLLKRHLYRIGKEKSSLFPVEKAIAHPEPRKALKRELKQALKLGETRDEKSIYLVDYKPDSALIKEIGRLREVSFRKVGEGSGKRRDLDRFDQNYDHIVLWDEAQLELAGAYRVVKTADVRKDLYTRSLFEFDEDFSPFLENGLELGRSFVQPAYWGSRALDYLWQGVGAYLRFNPDIRHLFGPVSISNAYPKGAINLLVSFYSLYFGAEEQLVRARQPYRMSRVEQADMEGVFTGDSYKCDLKTLKHMLRHYGVSIPILYKQYTEVYEPEGVKYLAWNIDFDFGDCVDGFLMADLRKMKSFHRRRYIDISE